MKKILVFEPLSGGHRNNFIRWIKEAAPAYSECRFLFFTDRDAGDVRLEKAGWWKKQMLLYRLFRKACREHRPDHVLLLELTHLEWPLILFGSSVPLSAILFVQYPELPHRLKFFFKHWKTRILLRRAPVENLFLLNGKKSGRFLDHHFGRRTQFIPVSDPAPEILPDPSILFEASEEKRTCLFFGAISRRKGADVLLSALKQLPSSVAEKNVFMFCGEPEPPYAEAYRKAVSEILERGSPQIHVEEGFVSDERMMAMFEQADLVLMPYIRPEYSSGILALAAKAGTPVLGPEDGLLGRLIQENRLGSVSKITAAALAVALEQPIEMDEEFRQRFVSNNTITGFTRPILNAICNEG